MVQVYREPLYRRHYCGVLSAPTLLRAAVLAGSVALAFVLAYATGAFWAKASWEIEQPTVHYTGDGIAVFEGLQAGGEQVWASSPELRELLGGSAAAVTVQAAEMDANFDGKPDAIHFTARLAAPGPVHSVKLLLQFSYTLQASARLKMYGLAYVEGASPLPGMALSVDGQLLLHQAAPLSRSSYSTTYNMPPLGEAAASSAAVPEADGLLRLPVLLSRYAGRNLTTELAPRHAVWTAGAGGGGEFLLDVTIRVPPHQLLLYRPSLGESLKWGWVQFLAAFTALWWLAARFEAAVFGLRLLGTRAVPDAAPPHRDTRKFKGDTF
ncbi:MAG: transmembrane protein [Monoraphidium minutum]|nr:MAG: transmembrane protein [Monoraphidium minutum]